MKVCTTLCVLMAVGSVQEASAHHPSTPALLQDDPVATQSQNDLRLRLSTLSFDSGNSSGQFWTFALLSQFRLSENFALRLQLPTHRFELDGEAGESGVGDIAASLVLATERAGNHLSYGIGVFLPTGNEEKGLGRGTTSIDTFVQGRRELLDSWSVIANLNLVASSPGEREMAHAFVEQQNDTELRSALGIGWGTGPLQAATTVSVKLPLAPSSVRGERFFSAAPSIAYRVRNVWLMALVELPMGARQMDWRASSSVAYRWQ